MNIKNKYSVALILLVALLNSSCFKYQDVEIINVADIKVKEISIKSINVEVAMQIKNPNQFNINVVDADLVLFIKEQKIGIANIKEKIVLPKKSNEIHHFTIQTTILDLSSGAIPLLMGLINNNNIELGVQGDIIATAKGVSKKIPIDFKDKIKL